jgi:hypothetical protein
MVQVWNEDCGAFGDCLQATGDAISAFEPYHREVLFEKWVMRIRYHQIRNILYAMDLLW